MTLHVAIIMDGNGRWAAEQGLPRAAGHLAGADAVRRVVEAAPSVQIRDLTLYAFSSDNWQRPVGEVSQLMALFEKFLRAERRRCADENVRVRVIGRRDRLESSLLREIRATEDFTANGEGLTLRIAVDYSSRDLLVRAAEQTPYAASRSCLAGLIAAAAHSDAIPDVDLLIRTGREKRLSDFLLWECAYAELYFTDCMWPDFGADELRTAVNDYCLRQRRFGAIPALDSSCPAIT